jgi:DNA-binding LacI/PurR family transcriptional regulator
MVTMQDVADHAGVSIATVSFVLNNTKPVSPATRARIQEAMAELGFRRNVVARALASRRTRIVAMAYPALEHRFSGSATEFFTSAAEKAADLDYHLVLWPVGNDGTELTELVAQGLVDGVLLMEVQLEDPRVTVLRATGTPFAMIGRTSDLEGLAHVDIDFETTTQDAVAHLYDLGHRRMVLVSGSLDQKSFRDYGPYIRTEVAYRRIAAEYGIETVVVECPSSAQAGREMAAKLLREHPRTTAVLALNEYTALGLMSGLNRLGRSVPADISILALLASPDVGSLGDPELSIMRSPGIELGRLGIEALVRLLDGHDPGPPQLVPCRLEIQGSTAPPAKKIRKRRA